MVASVQVPVEAEVFWRHNKHKPRTIYGLMVPRECKLLQFRQALEKETGP